MTGPMNNPQLAPEAEALAPCPFCGGPAEIVEDDESAFVQCLDVKMHRAIWFSGDNTAADQVRDEWNRRAPGSTGAVAPEPLTPELRAKIKAVRAGCEGVTLGPWEREEHFNNTYVIAPNGGTVAVLSWQRDVSGNAHRDGSHIARLDPDFVRQLCDLATHPAPADTGQGGRAELDRLLADEDFLEDDEELVDELHAEFKRQGAFTIERFGKVALAQAPFIGIMLRHIRAALDAGART